MVHTYTDENVVCMYPDEPFGGEVGTCNYRVGEMLSEPVSFETPLPLPDDYRPYNPPAWEWPDEHKGRALFWRCYLGAVAVVTIGCGLWAYYG